MGCVVVHTQGRIEWIFYRRRSIAEITKMMECAPLFDGIIEKYALSAGWVRWFRFAIRLINNTANSRVRQYSRSWLNVCAVWLEAECIYAERSRQWRRWYRWSRLSGIHLKLAPIANWVHAKTPVYFRTIIDDDGSFIMRHFGDRKRQICTLRTLCICAFIYMQIFATLDRKCMKLIECECSNGLISNAYSKSVGTMLIRKLFNERARIRN